MAAKKSSRTTEHVKPNRYICGVTSVIDVRGDGWFRSLGIETIEVQCDLIEAHAGPRHWDFVRGVHFHRSRLTSGLWIYTDDYHDVLVGDGSNPGVVKKYAQAG